MKRMILSGESVYASSFNRAIKHMNTNPCCFITAWRDKDENGNPLSTNAKVSRNRQLESDIRKSGLTFVKARGGFIEDKGTDKEKRVSESSFCVIDNKYGLDRFINLCVSWCKKYNQDAILITIPDRSKSSTIKVKGRYYDKDGNIEMEFDNVTIGSVEEYFTNICRHDFVLSSSEFFETSDYDIYSSTGRRLGNELFKDLYPDL